MDRKLEMGRHVCPWKGGPLGPPQRHGDEIGL